MSSLLSLLLPDLQLQSLLTPTDDIDVRVGDKNVKPYTSWKKFPGDSIIKPSHDSHKINTIVTGGETGPYFKACDFAYVTSSSIDKRCGASNDMCADESCGLPDEPVDYDWLVAFLILERSRRARMIDF